MLYVADSILSMKVVLHVRVHYWDHSRFKRNESLGETRLATRGKKYVLGEQTDKYLLAWHADAGRLYSLEAVAKQRQARNINCLFVCS